VTNRLVTLLTLAAITLVPAIALAQSPPERDGLATLSAIEATLADVIDKVEPSVVAISRTEPERRAAAAQLFTADPVFGDLRQFAQSEAAQSSVAAGVIIDPAGLVLTEFLAVRKDHVHMVTTTDGKTYAAEIRAADPRSGLAILAIQPLSTSPLQRTGSSEPPKLAKFPVIPLGDAALLRKGQFVIAIGNPYAIQTDGSPTASWGTVTNLARKAAPGTNFNDAPGPNQDYHTTLHHLGTLIQTDAKLGWISGGGALVNLRGELVGLTTTAATIAGHEQPAGYAIPINTTFRRIIDTLKEGREVEYGLLGVQLGMGALGTPAPADLRVTVQYAYPGSPGDRAGLAGGDVITRVNGQAIDDVDKLQLAVSALPPSTTTTVDYERGGKPATAKVTLAKLGLPGNKIVTNRPPAWRGIHVDYATALDASSLGQAIESKALDPTGCVLVSEVEPDSSAWRDGIRPNMFISHVGSQRVTTPEEFYAAIQGADDGSLDIRLTQPIVPPAIDEE
jgi:S1-C subfamily serine protease